MNGRRPFAIIALHAATACTPGPIALVGFEDVTFVAALVRDETGTITAGSEVRALAPGEALDLFTADDTPLLLVGWPASAFGDTTPDPAVAIAPRTGCAPRLPAPSRAALLDQESTSPLDPSTVPALSASWADALCPSIDPARFAYRADCASARVAPELSSTSACTFNLTLASPGAEPDPIEAAIADARDHGRRSDDPDHEVGDLQSLVRLLARHLGPRQVRVALSDWTPWDSDEEGDDEVGRAWVIVPAREGGRG